MEQQKKQDIIIGNGILKTPILANEGEHTEDQSNQHLEVGSIEQADTEKQTNGTKPQTLSETVSLLQTDCFDLKSFGCKVAILAQEGKIYLAIESPDHKFGFDTAKGNILIDGVSVVK